jgi:MFS family permease
MDHAGAVVGPLIAWVLLAAAGATPSQVILASLFPGMIAVAVVSWAMQRVENGTRKTGNSEQEGAGAGHMRDDTSSPSPRFLWALIVAFAFARFPEALLLLRIQELGVAVATVPLLWAALHVVRTAASYPGGWLSDTLGPRRTMLLGWGVYGMVCFGLAFAEGPGIAAVWLLIFGLVAAGTESPERAFIAAASRLGHRGRGYGTYHAAVGLAALPGGLLLGVVYHMLGAPVALVVSGGAVALLVGLGGFAPVRRS